MTNLENFTNILLKASVVFEINENEDFIDISIEAQQGPNNLGYVGFVTTFRFNKDGTLLNVGVWE